MDALIAEAIAATGATSIKDMGKVMAAGEGQGRGPRRHGRGQRADQAETELISPGARACAPCQACLQLGSLTRTVSTWHASRSTSSMS